MVKILQAYNFAKQHTFALNGELLSATLIGTNRIAISSAEQFIEIYDIEGKQRTNEADQSLAGVIQQQQQQQQQQQPTLSTTATSTTNGSDERVPLKYSLATVGEVVHLIYCEAGKYLLTLEKESVGSPVHSNSTSISCTSSSNSTTVYTEDETKMFVRIYANFWKFAETRLIDLPITIRIASMTTPKAPLVESIDVIELPLRSTPELIQCCQTSGNIIVGSKERIYLYEYTQCTHESTQPRFTYIDFLPFKFFVNLNFMPLKICLAENVIACMNNRYCVAFKIVDTLSANAGGTGGIGVDTLQGYYESNEAADVDEGVSTSAESSSVSKASLCPSSHNSFETDSLETSSSVAPMVGVSGFAGHTPVDFNVARMVNTACGRDFEVDLRSQWDQNEAPNGGVCGGAGVSTAGVGINCSVDTQEIIITPTRASEIKIKLVNEAKAMNVQRITSHSSMLAYNDDSSVQYDVRKLLQICMRTSEPNDRIVDILRCMDLKAIYQRLDDSDSANATTIPDAEYDMGNQQVPGAVSSSKHLNRRTLKSGRHQSCIGYALLVASSVDGYLYQFCAQGKWYNENEKPVAVYAFTAPVLHVHIGDYVIYAITNESVETHTSRIGHKLFHNRFEYPSIAELFPEESSPDVNAPIAVIGLCSFMHVQYVCVNGANLVLISNSTLTQAHDTSKDVVNATAHKRRSVGAVARLLAEAKAKHSQLLRSGSNNYTQPAVLANEWTLYNLVVPQVEHVIDDLAVIADTYRAASSSNFFDLMEEAHVMLRLSLSLQFSDMSEEREQCLRLKFMENCRKLADFAIRSKKRETYLQATGFYKMCQLQLPDIYMHYVNSLTRSEYDEQPHQDKPDVNIKAHNAEQLVGLVHTVKQYLMSLGADRQRAAFLNQSMRPFFTPNRVVAQGYAQVPLSLELLNLFVKYSPADLPQIMLQSPVIADAISGELINYLNYLDELNPEENLLLAVTACRMSNYLLAQEVIAKTSRRNLAIALIKHKNVLFDDGTQLYQKSAATTHTRADNNSCSSKSMRTSKPVGTRRAAQQQQQRFKPVLGMQSSQAGAQSQTLGKAVYSFSDFTETILLACEQSDLIEAVSDAFIHALCIDRSVTLDMLMQLFLNYIATHIGHKGYQTSQKVFANVLQVYFYDYYDVSALQQNAANLQYAASPPVTVTQHFGVDDAEEDDYDDGTSSKAPSLNSERDNDSLVNSSLPGDTNSAASSASADEPGLCRNNRIVYDQLQEQHSPYKRNYSPLTQQQQQQQALQQPPQLHDNPADDEVNLKGIKILFRMYLGRQKALSDLNSELQSADVEQQQQTPHEDFHNLRLECVRFMLRYLQELRQQQQQRQQQQPNIKCKMSYYNKSHNHLPLRHNVTAQQQLQQQQLVYVPYMPDYKLQPEEFEEHVKSYIRPIPCLLDRPQYLNRLPPFKRSDFSYPNNDNGDFEVHFVGWHNELLTQTLKIQSLLASPRIEREIIEEFIAFIQKTPDLIGIDSFLVIIMPKHLAINYMLNFAPEFLWQYGKSNNFTPKHWESLLRKILSKQDLLPNWKTHITEILNNLVAELSFEELLQCFPSEVIQQRSATVFLKELQEHQIDLGVDNTTNDINKRNLAKTTNIDGHNSEQIKHKMITLDRNHVPMDNIDEENVFELILRKAVAKQRSIALRTMVISTGTQLFDATTNPMYNL